MIIYLLKFSACLFIFLAFYKLVMERESMHQIKRYFLLVALVLSLCIPLITFIQYVEPVVLTNTFVVSTDQILTDELLVETPPVINYLPILLWSLYGLGAVYFGIKFVWNLSQIVIKIKRHPKQKNKSYIHVLLNDLIVPHTFFNYIFLNKHKFETNTIPKEVFWHEEAHAKQKHSLDVIFIELIQVIFWFNPLIYFTKSAIKMNHEFLADEAVLKHGIEPSIYQQLLLAFSSNALEPVLANAINYSSIKKRFTVMKTHTSKQKIWLRSFLLLPLVALTLYGFSERKEVVKDISIQLNEQSQTLQGEGATTEMMKEYNDWIKQINGSSTLFIPVGTFERLVAIYDLMSEVQRNSVESHPSFLNTNLYKVKPNIPTTAQFESWKNIKEFALWIDGKHVPNSELNKYEVRDIAHFTSSMVHKNAKSEKFPQPFQISLYTKQGFKETYQMSAINDYKVVTNTYTKAIAYYLKGSQIDNSELKILKAQADKFYNQFNKDELKEYGILPVPPVPAEESSNSKMLKENLKESVDKTNNSPNHNQSATPEEIAEYNKLAKYYNSQTPNNSRVTQKDVERITVLYNKMDKDQKANAEPFPNFPPPPPPPAPETGFIEVNGETLFYVKFIPIEYYNKKGYKVDENGKTLNGNKQVNASDVLPGQYITKVYQNDKVVVEFKDNGAENVPPPPPPARETPKLMKGNDIPPPPPPPAPISPLEHIKEMAKKGAMFYYDGKAISFDDASNLIKKNDELNISTTKSNSNPIKVTITEKPILIDTQTRSEDKIMMNGKILNDNFIQLSKDEFMKAKFSTVRGDVSIFQLKIPGQKTQSIKGNTLNAESKNNLEKAQIGDHILIFGIKDSQGNALSPITIEIKK